MAINKVTIVGMGALGVLFGDFFTRKLGKSNVEFVADEARIDKYKKEGVICNGIPCDFTVVSEDETNKPADLLIFAVKANSLNSAIKSARNKVSQDTIILSLINGISSEEIIGQVFGMDKIIYCVAQGMDAVKIGNVLTYKNMGQLCIGIMEHESNKTDKLQAVVDLFQNTGLPYTLEADIKHRLWSKFMLNVGLNQSVMIYEGTYGTVQQPGEARDLMKAAMREVILIAEKENVPVTEKDLDEYVSLVDTLNPNGMPSMRQDGLARRKSEVEFFSGTVLKLGKKHGVPTPVNQKIYDRILSMESEY
ncbi:MAG TPA: ketopantoate reductase family protein [Clostridiaceae bacterium]|nr:ketopantoate reductase family protein [Clostridiaceae bacterium]